MASDASGVRSCAFVLGAAAKLLERIAVEVFTFCTAPHVNDYSPDSSRSLQCVTPQMLQGCVSSWAGKSRNRRGVVPQLELEVAALEVVFDLTGFPDGFVQVRKQGSEG